MSWLQLLSPEPSRRLGVLMLSSDKDSSSDEDSNEEYEEESDGSIGDDEKIVSQLPRSVRTTRRALTRNSCFNHGGTVDCDEEISEEGSVNNEDDEGTGNDHESNDDEEEAYIITTKYGRETEEELHALKIPELKDRLRDMNKKLTAPRKQAYINRFNTNRMKMIIRNAVLTYIVWIPVHTGI